MMQACRLLAALLGAVPAAAVAQDFTTPSGLSVSIAEVMVQPEADTVRLRLLAPTLGQAGAGYEEVSHDFVWICEAQVIPALSDNGLNPAKVVISIADRSIAFGETDPEATQFFEGFTVNGNTCVWELY